MIKKKIYKYDKYKSLLFINNLGVFPYREKKYNLTHIIGKINHFNVNNIISTAGRLIELRIMGKAAFGRIKDTTGNIQIYINSTFTKFNQFSNISYKMFIKKAINIGDIIGVLGNIFYTKMNELTIKVSNITILSKSLLPIPIVKKNIKKNKLYSKFSNIEKRYRMRYLDIMVNDNIKSIFILRSKVIETIRNLLNKNGYIEVDTPVLQYIPGGAVAKPFITYHNYSKRNMYLRISNELYLKRLMISGFSGVYEFSKDFRNEGIDKYHNPEFTVLELYVSYKDYIWMMEFLEKLLLNIIKKIYKEFNKLINILDINLPFSRINYYDILKKNTGIDICSNNIDKKLIFNLCKKLHIEYEKKNNIFKIIDSIFDKRCQNKCIDPTFIVNHPIEISPLAKRNTCNSILSQRFELIINGIEVANGYSELNDPIEQISRFEYQRSFVKDKNNDDFFDKDFIKALMYGLPPTVGIGIGIDRLIMLLTKQNSIHDTILFPYMKNK